MNGNVEWCTNNFVDNNQVEIKECISAGKCVEKACNNVEWCCKLTINLTMI